MSRRASPAASSTPPRARHAPPSYRPPPTLPHPLTQEGAFAAPPKARRRELPLIAAEWFAPHDPVLHAQHLDRADAARAPMAYLEASMAQRAVPHAEAALLLVERGLGIVRDDKDRFALTCFKGELLRDQGDIAASIATYREAVATATDEASLCRAQLGL